jgi:3-oxoacyl-(acyl-carrier-protein) synthase/enoyl-CoA hydratase/carnithine racemase
MRTFTPHTPASADICIVGLSCRFPGAASPADFFKLLIGGHNAFSTVPAERWPSLQSAELLGLTFAPLLGLFEFDNRRFSISPREAEAMDPHHRLMIEASLGAIEDAGYTTTEFAKRRTGVFVGIYNDDFSVYARNGDWERESLIYLGTGSAHAILPNRLSYLFGFEGPSEIINTACSTSLVALHRAAQSIRLGECEQALVGAVSLLLDPERLKTLCRLGLISREKTPRLFAATPTGQVLGEGVGCVVLKRRDAAVTDNDHIYGVLKASAVGHRGRRSGRLTLPDAASQLDLMQTLYETNHIPPDCVSYVESHGSGGMGDLLELSALQQFFHSDAYVGSVKANVGCLEAAGGMTQIIKVLLSMKHDVIPGSLNIDSLTPAHLAGCKTLTCNVDVGTLNRDPSMPWIAAVNAYGIGGVNAHVVLQSPDSLRTAAHLDAKVPILLTGKTHEHVRAAAQALLLDFSAPRPPMLRDVAFTLAVGRSHEAIRHAFCASSAPEAIEALRTIAEGGNAPCPAANHDLCVDISRWQDGTAISWTRHLLGGRRTSIPGTVLHRRRFDLPKLRTAIVQKTVDTAIMNTANSLGSYIQSFVARQSRLRLTDIEPMRPISDYGIGSIELVDLCSMISTNFGISVSPASLDPHGSLVDIERAVNECQERVPKSAAGESRIDDVDDRDRPTEIPLSLPTRRVEFARQLAQLKCSVHSDALDFSNSRHEYDGFRIGIDGIRNVWIFMDLGPGNMFSATAISTLTRVLRDICDGRFSNPTVVYLTHLTDHFSLGGDRKAFADSVDRNTDEVAAVRTSYLEYLQALEKLPAVMVGIAYGSAQGGGLELLLSCDLQMVWPGVKLGFPEVRSGLIAGMGGLTYTASIVGVPRAMLLATSGQSISSDEAYQWGLISHISAVPFADALAFGASPNNWAAMIESRRIICKSKCALLAADVDDWTNFTNTGHLLAHRDQISIDYGLIKRTTQQ